MITKLISCLYGKPVAPSQAMDHTHPMIDADRARAIATGWIGGTCSLTEQTPLRGTQLVGYYFEFQTRVFLRTKNPFEGLLGGGRFIVDARDGHVIVSGRHPSTTMTKVLEAGFRWHPYDLTVTHVDDIERSATLLHRLEVHVVTPERVNGRWWRIPQPQPLEVIRDKLQDLPVTFGPQSIHDVARFVDVVREAQRDKVLALDIREHRRVAMDEPTTP